MVILDLGLRTTCNCPIASCMDPHDNFLDTPWRLFKVGMVFGEKSTTIPLLTKCKSKLPCSASIDVKASGNAKAKPPTPKFNQFVLKNLDRKLLQPTMCNLYSKFYDCFHVHAQESTYCYVCPEASRHRFQYEPPRTSLRFWDIGFPNKE